MKKLKIAINGATSTGKTTFLKQLSRSLTDRDIKNEIITDLAIGCPLPIKKEHTIESTLWIAAKCMLQEIEAQHRSDVVLVDRSILDCWAYFNAVCKGRYDEKNPKLLMLTSMIENWIPTYDFLYNTVINKDMLIEDKKGRDLDVEYRNKIDEEMKEANLFFNVTPHYLRYGDAQPEVDFLLAHINNL